MSWKSFRLIAQLLVILALLPGSTSPSQAGTMIGSPPSSWTSLDINTSTPGETLESGFQLTLSGSGTGIGGTRDGFRYAYDELTGDLEIQAKVTSWNSAGSATAKGGLMMRSSTNPDAAFALVALTGKKGVRFQTGANQVSFAGSPAAFNLVSPYEIRASVPEGATSGVLSVLSPYGEATSSAGFRVLSWTSLDIGYDYGDIPETVQQGDMLRVKASGWGVKDASDGFRYAFESASGNLELTAFVSSFSGFQASQAGVMLRSHTGPDSAFAFLYTDPYGNLQYQWRTGDGLQSQSVWLRGLTLPFWIRLVRYGNLISAAYSLDGKVYLFEQNATQAIELPNAVLAGPATSSGREGEYATAEYMYITINPYYGPIFGVTGSP